MHFRTYNVEAFEKVSRVLSCLAGVALIALSAYELGRISSSAGGSVMAVFAYSLFALGKGVLGVILIAPSLTRLLLAPVFKMVDLTIFPTHYERKPPLNYRLADYYCTTRQFDLAIEWYSEIIRHYPVEAVAHARLYLIHHQISEAPGKSRRTFRKARRCLRGSDRWEQFLDLIGKGDLRAWEGE